MDSGGCEGFRRDRGCWRVVCVCLSTNHACVCVCTVLCSACGSKILSFFLSFFLKRPALLPATHTHTQERATVFKSGALSLAMACDVLTVTLHNINTSITHPSHALFFPTTVAHDSRRLRPMRRPVGASSTTTSQQQPPRARSRLACLFHTVGSVASTRAATDLTHSASTAACRAAMREFPSGAM